eukprot:gene40256-53201_t
MRVLGRWMRMITIPNQSSVAKAYQEFDVDGRMKPSSYYERVVDVLEELMKFTYLTRDVSGYLTNRYRDFMITLAKTQVVGFIQVADAVSARNFYESVL